MSLWCYTLVIMTTGLYIIFDLQFEGSSGELAEDRLGIEGV